MEIVNRHLNPIFNQTAGVWQVSSPAEHVRTLLLEAAALIVSKQVYLLERGKKD